MVSLILAVAEQAAKRSLKYHTEKSARISPVLVFLLDCSHCSKSTYLI